MTQYIDKDALVAEIEKLDEFYHLSKGSGGQSFIESLLSFLDSLETKEVDLENEIDEVIHNYKLNNHRHTSICSADIEWIAEHFFELGIKVQTNIKMPNLEDIFIENGIDLNSKQAKIFKESYYTALEKLKA